MAIDDNTLYGLTGAQVKELPERIEAVKGLAKELTSADYNYPVGSPDGVALWKLPKGLYYTEPGVKKYISTSKSESASETILIGIQNDTNVSVTIFGDGVSIGFMRRFSTNSATGGEGTSVYSYGLTNRDIIDSLTSTATDKALSARQGKVLKDLIDSIAIRGAGAPTTSTVGEVGQLYEDGTNGALYQLKSIDITVTPNTYNWEEVGAGGGGPTVVQTTGTSTTDVMSQKATSDMIFSPGWDPATKYNDAIRVQIGRATASSNASIAIGAGTPGSLATAPGNGSVVIGTAASSSGFGGVAIGYGAKATQRGQFDISATTNNSSHIWGYNGSDYRLLTGLYDPQNAHDAATKGYVDGLVGNIASALNVINNGTGA